MLNSIPAVTGVLIGVSLTIIVLLRIPHFIRAMRAVDQESGSKSNGEHEYDFICIKNELVTGMWCGVCYEYLPDAGKVLLLRCGHIFCATCIKIWLKTIEQSCPTCRAPMRRTKTKTNCTDVVLNMEGEQVKVITPKAPPAVAKEV